MDVKEVGSSHELIGSFIENMFYINTSDALQLYLMLLIYTCIYIYIYIYMHAKMNLFVGDIHANLVILSNEMTILKSTRPNLSNG